MKLLININFRIKARPWGHDINSHGIAGTGVVWLWLILLPAKGNAGLEVGAWTAQFHAFCYWVGYRTVKL